MMRLRCTRAASGAQGLGRQNVAKMRCARGFGVSARARRDSRVTKRSVTAGASFGPATRSSKLVGANQSRGGASIAQRNCHVEGSIMSEKTDLSWAESVQKIQHIAEGEVAMMHTFNGRKVGVARPMMTAGVDEDGTLWFLSHEDSPKNAQLEEDEVMQLTYSLKSRSEYLVLDGRGSVL